MTVPADHRSLGVDNTPGLYFPTLILSFSFTATMDDKATNITSEQAARSHESKSDIALGVAVGLIVLGCVLVTIRLCCRRIIRSVGWDDLFIVMGLVSVEFYMLGWWDLTNILLLALLHSLWNFDSCQYVLCRPTSTLLTLLSDEVRSWKARLDIDT